MKSVYSVVSACSVLALFSSIAVQAAPLTGTMLINPGTTTVIDANGNTAYSGGSYFAMGGIANAIVLSPGSAGGITLGVYQNFVLDPDVPHLFNWDGMGGGAGTGYNRAGPVTQSDMVTPFAFGSSLVHMGTNPISYQSGEQHAAPTADISNCVAGQCTLSVDLSSWEVVWNGSAFQQGSRPSNSGPFVMAVGSYDMNTTAYSLTWTSQIKGGPFDGVTPTWHLDGTVSAVPVPAAIWLLGSGLVGLYGVARRKVVVA